MRWIVKKKLSRKVVSKTLRDKKNLLFLEKTKQNKDKRIVGGGGGYRSGSVDGI